MAASSGTRTSSAGGGIVWHENDGGGAFAGAESIGPGGGPAWALHAADLDGDGRIDILASSWSGSATAPSDGVTIAWHRNLGGGRFAEPTPIAGGQAARDLRAADLDGDGDLEVLGASVGAGEVVWYENRPSNETDTDGDGVADADDADADGDGMPDDFEAAQGLDPRADDARGDADGDGASNFDEYLAGTDPNDTASVAARRHVVPLFPAAGRDGRQGFVRAINHSDGAGTVRVDAIDDMGRRYDPVTFAVAGRATVHFNADDLEDGNPAKLDGSTGPGEGDWRLEVATEPADLDLEVLAYVRTGDGFLTAMHDTGARSGNRHFLPTFNPGSNANQRSVLRLFNRHDGAAEVGIRGVDDAGRPGGEVSLAVPAGEARRPPS